MRRMKIALAQINPTIGDVSGNAAKCRDAIEAARQRGVDLVVLPELAISGYPPKDLLLEEGFVDACAAAAKALGEGGTRGLTAVFGCPLPAEGGGIANSLLVYSDGRYIDYYDKRLLPTYDVFDEDRYFVPGERTVIAEIAGKRIGLSVCEDLWRGVDAGFSSRYRNDPDPVEECVKAGAEIIVSPSASPFVLGKGLRHREILAAHATRHGVHVVSVNVVGGNDELIFDGHSMVYGPDGSVLASAPGFETGIVVLDLEDPSTSRDVRKETSAEELLFRALTLGVHDYLGKTGFSSAIVGLSGGIDSALTACIAAAAIGAENVLGVAMPGPYSSPGSETDAKDLADRLGLNYVTVPIAGPFDAFSHAIDAGFEELELRQLGERLPDVTEENLQSRIRGTVLMALSNRTGAILLTTGNKSEVAVGYCTLYGDMNGGLAVLSDVTKRQVYAVSEWINDHHEAAGFRSAPIPRSTIEKPPSAELAPDQKDSDSLPEYDVLDEIIRRTIEEKQSPGTIERETRFDRATIDRVMRLIQINEYKRKQMATGLKVTSVAFGVGRRMPIAQGWRWE